MEDQDHLDPSSIRLCFQFGRTKGKSVAIEQCTNKWLYFLFSLSQVVVFFLLSFYLFSSLGNHPFCRSSTISVFFSIFCLNIFARCLDFSIWLGWSKASFWCNPLSWGNFLIIFANRPYAGFFLEGFVALIFRQPWLRIKTIAIETGIQNTGISILLMKFSLPQPDADLSLISPVAVATFTPIPLIFAIIYYEKSEEVEWMPMFSCKLQQTLSFYTRRGYITDCSTLFQSF